MNVSLVRRMICCLIYAQIVRWLLVWHHVNVPEYWWDRWVWKYNGNDSDHTANKRWFWILRHHLFCLYTVVKFFFAITDAYMSSIEHTILENYWTQSPRADALERADGFPSPTLDSFPHTPTHSLPPVSDSHKIFIWKLHISPFIFLKNGNNAISNAPTC